MKNGSVGKPCTEANTAIPTPKSGDDERPNTVVPTTALPVLFIDWAKSSKKSKKPKGLTIAEPGMQKSRKLEGDNLIASLLEAYPPPRRLYIEGIPRIRWDELLDLGYVVWYCNTRALASIRRGDVNPPNPGAPPATASLSSEIDEDSPGDDVTLTDSVAVPVARQKSDSNDPMMLMKFADQIRWYRAERTEPLVIEAIRLFSRRDLLLSLSKLAAQQEQSESYKDASFFRAKHDAIVIERNEAEKEIVRFCKRIGLHPFHAGGDVARPNSVEHAAASPFISPTGGDVLQPNSAGISAARPGIFGVSCLTMVFAFTKRPWAFSKNGWMHYTGCTKHAWDEKHAQRRGKGSDADLKRLLYGAVMVLIGKKSPYRPLYDEAKARLPFIVKHGKAGHGNFKVTPHARALNRVVSHVIGEIYETGVAWSKIGTN